MRGTNGCNPQESYAESCARHACRGAVTIGAQANAETSPTKVSALKGQHAELGAGDAPDFVLAGADDTQRLVAHVRKLADSAGITPHSSPESVGYTKAKVYTIDFGSETATVVSFPISGPQHVELSNLTFVLDSKEEIVEYAESIVTQADGGPFEITMYEGGELLRTDSVDPSEVSGNSDGIELMVSSEVKCVAAVLGVTVVIAALIVNMCGASCAVPYTPPTAAVCAACIGGVATVGGASIAAVMGCLS